MMKVDNDINIADLFTKALPVQRFEFLVEFMGMRDYGCPGDPPAHHHGLQAASSKNATLAA